jgi:hypothetical protein
MHEVRVVGPRNLAFQPCMQSLGGKGGECCQHDIHGKVQPAIKVIHKMVAHARNGAAVIKKKADRKKENIAT